ncbi:PilN domain-containing protein [Methylomagnum sp.]
MAGINLLPWRAERRKQKQQEFFSITALTLLVTVGILAFIHWQISGMIDNQTQRNDYLQSEVALLDQKIKEIEDLEAKKKRLIAKMEVIQQLQLSRPEIVHLFDELARTIPEGVLLTDLIQADKLLTINGIAQSNSRVSAYMRGLDASPWFQDPALTEIVAQQEIKGKRDIRGSKFILQVKQSSETKDSKEHKGKSPS